MPSNTPPGITYLVSRLPTFLLPLAAMFVFNKLANAYLKNGLPFWAVILATILSVPVTALLKLTFTDYVDHRSAAGQGAILPPRVYDKWPGGVGLLLELTRNLKTGYPGDNFKERSLRYGNTFNIRVLFENRFFTVEPDYIKAILATQSDAFEKGPNFYFQMKSFLGTGVFNSDGEMWKFHRAMTRPFFSKERITHFDIFERHAQDAIQQLKVRLNEGWPVDIQDLASRFTMDSATEFLFSKDVQSLRAGLPYPHYSNISQSSDSANHPANIFSKAFDDAQKTVVFRSRWGVAWPLTEFWKDQVQEKMGPIYDFINPILADAVQRKRAAGSGDKISNTSLNDREVQDGESLLDHLINYTDDEIVLRDEILNILLAGRDTTTNSITYAIYMLANHPNVLGRLRDEIISKLGSSNRPTYEDMKDMKYLRAVINETLRLYPAVPFNVRSTNKPVLLPSKIGGKPFYIPANSRTQYSVFLMHRRTDLWGPDANEFDPDRFIDERLHKYLTANPFIFLPFNAGPRICLGQQFAYHETSYFLIRLLQNFSSITMAPEAQPPESLPPASWKNAIGPKSDSLRPRTLLTMSILGGCWLRMEEDAEPVDTGN